MLTEMSKNEKISSAPFGFRLWFEGGQAQVLSWARISFVRLRICRFWKITVFLKTTWCWSTCFAPRRPRSESWRSFRSWAFWRPRCTRWHPTTSARSTSEPTDRSSDPSHPKKIKLSFRRFSELDQSWIRKKCQNKNVVRQNFDVFDQYHVFKKLLFDDGSADLKSQNVSEIDDRFFFNSSAAESSDLKILFLTWLRFPEAADAAWAEKRWAPSVGAIFQVSTCPWPWHTGSSSHRLSKLSRLRTEQVPKGFSPFSLIWLGWTSHEFFLTLSYSRNVEKNNSCPAIPIKVE